MTVLATLALIAGLAAAAAPLAQARRIVRRRSSDDVSLWWLGLYGFGCLVWFAYGISIASVPLIATQALAGIGAGTALLLGLHFRDLPEASLWAPLRRLRRRLARRLGSTRRTRPVAAPTPSVPAELVVEEARRTYFRDGDGDRALPVVDRWGRAVGILRGSDIAALPPSERASLLVTDLADREALIARVEVEPARPAEHRSVVRAGLALAAERRRQRAAVGAPSASDGHAPRRSSGDDDRHTRRASRKRRTTVPVRGARR